MLKRVIDCRKRCACYVDALTGRVEHEWKRVRTKTWIPIGGVYQLERDGTVTVLRRISTEEFEIKSYEIAT